MSWTRHIPLSGITSDILEYRCEETGKDINVRIVETLFMFETISEVHGWYDIVYLPKTGWTQHWQEQPYQTPQTATFTLPVNNDTGTCFVTRHDNNDVKIASQIHQAAQSGAALVTENEITVERSLLKIMLPDLLQAGLVLPPLQAMQVATSVQSLTDTLFAPR